MAAFDPRKTSYKHTPLANTDAAITIDADADHAWVVEEIDWSYSAAPTGGQVSILYDLVVKWRLDVPNAGLGSFRFPNGFFQTVKNQELYVKLTAGGAGVTGKLAIRVR